MRKWVAIIAVLVVTFCSVTTNAVSSELEDKRLLKIQVAYLLNFAKFISWPETDKAPGEQPFVIGVYGDNPFKDLLVGLEKKTVEGHVIKTQVFTSLSQTDDCQILFVGSQTLKQHEIVTLLDYLDGKPVVTISTVPGFVRNGGIIELQQHGEHVLFSVNLERAKKSGLVIPAQVLVLAVEVIQGVQ